MTANSELGLHLEILEWTLAVGFVLSHKFQSGPTSLQFSVCSNRTAGGTRYTSEVAACSVSLGSLS